MGAGDGVPPANASGGRSSGDGSGGSSSSGKDTVAVSVDVGEGIDRDDDGTLDLVDADGDGTGDYPLVDVDGDGQVDGYAIDTDDDGVADELHGLGEVIAPGRCISLEAEVFDSPLVYVLIDRSSSMFELGNPWVELKEALLPELEARAEHAKMGFGSFTGIAGACTGLTEGAPIRLDNFAAIKAAYDSLVEPEGKGETPTALVVQQATQLLLDADGEGERILLLVTDGNPDFCDDLYGDCAVDATIASLQDASRRGVRTEVFGFDNGSVNPNFLNYFATAGQGNGPDWDRGATYGEFAGLLHGSCDLVPEWHTYRSLREDVDEFEGGGMYSTTDPQSSALVISDADQLATKISEAVEEIISCMR